MEGCEWWHDMVLLQNDNWQLQNSHGEVKHSLGDIVSNIAITMDGVR